MCARAHSVGKVLGQSSAPLFVAALSLSPAGFFHFGGDVSSVRDRVAAVHRNSNMPSRERFPCNRGADYFS